MFFRKKIKKFLEYFHKGQPSSECNDSEVKALLEAGEKMQRSAFHSSPASPEFKAKLLAEIKEKRRLNQSSMQDKFNGWLREVFHPTRLKAAVALTVLVAVVATAFHFWPGEESRLSRLLIDTAHAQDNFEVEPTKSDSIGIESNTAFVIKSKVPVDRGTLEKNIKLFPEVKFELQQVNDKEFKLTPKEELKPKTVYRVYITSAYVDENGITTDRNYSWAFQVKNIFKVLHTLPANRATGVPVNSGIEVTFSHENIQSFEKNFSIQPKVNGRFEHHKRTAVFVPRDLQPGTIYTVTVKNGVGVKGSVETLDKELTFQFETMPSDEDRVNRPSFYFTSNFVEFDTAHAPALPGYFSGVNEKTTTSSATITVYAYKDPVDFAKSIEEYYRVPSWANFNRNAQRIDVSRLTKIRTFTAPEERLGYRSYIVFPEKLPAGYYLVRGTLPGGEAYPSEAFLQITDLASYLNVNTNKTLVWVNDMTTGKPVSGAHVESTDKKISVSTDQSGVATFETVRLGKPEQDYYSLDRYLTISAGSKSAVVPVTVYNDFYGNEAADNHWVYLYTDRQLYQGNDTVNAWGFLQRRDAKAIKEPLKLEIMSGGYDYFGDPIVIAETDVRLDENGSWISKLPLKSVKPGLYYLNFKVGETSVASRSIQVEKYVKPAYSIEVTPDKRAVFGGEKMIFNISATFFEGTPLSDLALVYEIGALKGEVTTDAAGAARVEIDSSRLGRYDQTFSAWPKNAEEAEIAGSATVSIFPERITVESIAQQVNDTTAKLTTKINHVDLEPINRGSADIYDGFVGAPAKNLAFTADITEISYNRREVGEYYDFINKVTHKRYTYDRVTKLLTRYSGVTNEQGTAEYQFAIDPYKSYEALVSATDSAGSVVSNHAYLYTVKGYEGYNDFREYYDVKVHDDKVPGFSIGETVPVSFTKNGQPLDASTGSFLFLKQQRGLVDYTLSASPKYEFVFAEKDIPNVYMDGVWFDGKLYHKTEPRYWMWDEGDYYNASIVRYNSADKELTVKVTPDKPKYAPGEEVKLRVRVTDKKGDAIKTNVNLNLVDEAFYQLSYETAAPLPALYNNVDRGGLYAYSSHEYLILEEDMAGGAEGGGCFLGGTKIKMADGTEKNIEDIRAGDTILTFADEYQTTLVPAKVSKTYQHLVRKYLVINNNLFVTPEHRVFVNHTWRPIGDTKVGDVLLDYRGFPVRINSIEVRDQLVPVYNFEVEGKHTYIANGIYVHNDKGGERQNFTDVALFQTVETDYRGEAEVKFKLPDNLTSWRVTSQAISKDVQAGVSVTKLPVSLPLFADATLASEYLVSDKPIVKARAFGESLKSGDKLNVTFEAPSLNIAKQTKAAEAFKPTYLDFPSLTLGEHAVKVGVERGSGKDVLVRKINVIPSRVEERTQEFYELKEGLDITGSNTARTTLVFSDKNRGQYYASLWDLHYCYCGARVDQKLSRALSVELLQKYFPNDPARWYYNPEQLDATLYQTEDGGISLLPYSDAELELSAKVTAAAGERFDRVALSNYFYAKLNDERASTEELSQALFGLAHLDEPVLLPVKNLLNVDGLTVRDRLYLALAAEQLGDSEFARDIYEKAIEDYGEEMRPYLRLKAGKDQDDYLSNTILAAWLGAALNNNLHESLWGYAQENATTDILINLEELVYLKLALPNLRPDSVSFTVTRNGKNKEIKLENGQQATLDVSPDELKNLEFSRINGRVGVVSVYDRPVASPNKKRDAYVNLERRYAGRGESANRQTFKENDMVRISLSARISPDSLDGLYEVTDFVPSGLKVITRVYERNLELTACYPYEIDGQKVKFLIGKDYAWSHCNREITYYARVVGPGTYTAEPAVIQSTKSMEIKNYSSRGEITITP